MNCPVCGRDAKPDAASCRYCNAPLGRARVGVPLEVALERKHRAKEEARRDRAKLRRRTLRHVAAGSVFFLLVSVIVALVSVILWESGGLFGAVFAGGSAGEMLYGALALVALSVVTGATLGIVVGRRNPGLLWGGITGAVLFATVLNLVNLGTTLGLEEPWAAVAAYAVVGGVAGFFPGAIVGKHVELDPE
jgi:hypothetical protein